MSLINLLRTPKFPFTEFVVFDWVATYIAAYYLAQHYQRSLWTVFIFLIVVSVILHIIFDVPTVTNYYLGLSGYPSR